MSTGEVSRSILCSGCQTIDSQTSAFVFYVVGYFIELITVEFPYFATHGRHGFLFAGISIGVQQLQWLSAQA
jgi:hypothetical protein